MEMNSQLNQFPSEMVLVNDFPNVISRIVENISSFDLEFRNSFLGGNLQCQKCKSKLSVGLFDTIQVRIENCLEDIQDLAKLIEEKITKCHKQESTICERLTISTKNKHFLIVIIHGEYTIKLSKCMKLMETNYEVLSFSSINSESIGKTTFRFNGNFYTSEDGSIPMITNLTESHRVNVMLFAQGDPDFQKKRSRAFYI